MTEVALKRITVENWQECIELSVKDDQVDFVPSNLYSIAEAQFYPKAVPLAIHNVEGQMVGFIMYGIDVASGKWKVFRLMIDKAHQGRGYGRAAMEQVVQQLAGRPDCDEILICYNTTNHAARELYADLGFLEQEISDGKVLARLDLTN
jgi:diamine N-acetyltransferase